MESVEIMFTMLDERAIEPRNAYGNDAGWDLFALTATSVPPYGVTDIRTGLAIAIPDGYYGRIVARSSTWRKRGVGIVEGIIDAGFRGELFAGAYMLRHMALDGNQQAYEVQDKIIEQGESICQLIIQEVKPVKFVLADKLSDSLRGTSGFGSSDA